MNKGVYPCYKNQFQIDTAAAGAEEKVMANIADMETFGVDFGNGVEEWTPYDTEGWVRRLMTGKGVVISVEGKRNIGDTGNDTVAGLVFKNGRDVERTFAWTFPDGTVITLNDAVINVKDTGAGESTAVAPLKFDVMSNGKPEVVLPA